MKYSIIYLFLICSFDSFSQNELKNVDSSILILFKSQWLKSENTVSQKITSIKNIISFYFDNQIQSDSLTKYCDLYIDFSLKHKQNEAILDAFFRKVNVLRYQSKWIDLIKFGGNSLEIIKKNKIPASAYQMSIITDEMVYGYLFLRDLENVNFYADQSILALKKDNKNGSNNAQLSQVFLTKARSYGYVGKFDFGNFFLDSALVYINKTEEKTKKHYLYNDIVSNKIELNNFNEALPLALECLRFFEKIPTDRGLSEIQMLIGRIYLAKKKYDKSIEISQESLLKTQNPRILYHCYENLYQSYKAKGMMSKSLFALEKYHIYLDKLFNAKLANEKLALEKRSMDEKSRIRLNIETEKIGVQKVYRNYFIGGAILFFILTILLFFNRKSIQKQKQKIENQHITIQELNRDLEKKVEIRTAELQLALDEIKEAMQRGQTLERKRMAADLHDNLGSLLTAINISLDNINPEHLSVREQKIYSNILSMAENAYAEIRLLSHNLMPEELEKEGLANALKRMIKKINMNQKIRIELIIKELHFSNKTIELNIYAICLEMIQNIIKHSEATEATISIFEKANTLWLEVIDNGTGINQTKEKGFGLKNIQSRLDALDGELFIDSEKTKGTKLVVSVPLVFEK